MNNYTNRNSEHSPVYQGKHKFYISNQSGLTLIETLIYSILVAGLLAGALISVYQLLEGSEELNLITTTEEEANFILRKIQWALTGIDSINFPGPGDSDSILITNKINYAQNPILFQLDGTDIKMSRGGGSLNSLNSSRVTIENLLFTHLASAGEKPAGIKTEIVINGAEYETLIYFK
ncbi:MAG TPA: hypothetical protein VI432_00645 [Candidatus Paceibacterota bacterium]